MVIAFDIDDTITRHPPFFSFLTKALVEAGHQVVIITFREDRRMVSADLARMGIVFTKLVTSTTKDLLAADPDKWKARVCKRMGVEVFFEDMPEVLQHLGESVVGMMPVNRDHRLDLLAAHRADEIEPL